MISARNLDRVEKLVWVLVYGGLVTLVLGIATSRTHATLGWTLFGIGAVVALIGVILIPMRAGMHQAPDTRAKPEPSDSPGP